MSENDTVYRFSNLALDTACRRLLRRGNPVELQPKPFELLLFLVRNRQRAVSKDDLLAHLWPDEHVGESSLTACVRRLRRALQDDFESPQIIETVHGLGYRFIAPLKDATAAETDAHPGYGGGRTQLRGTPSADPPLPAEEPETAGIVGRAAELDRLHAAWSRARGGHRQVTFVTGESGIGKTTLVQAFLSTLQANASAADSAPWVLWGNCVEQHSASEPFMPLLDACLRACRGEDAERAVQVLREYAPAWLLQIPGVLNPGEREQLRAEWSGSTPERLLRMLAEVFTQLAAVRPLILVLDDLHWSDGATIDVLARIAADPSPARLLLIGTFRPADAALQRPELTALATRLLTHRRCDEIALHYFDADAIAALIALNFENAPAARARCALLFSSAQNHLGAADDNATEYQLRVHLFERTHGHPLFVNAMLDHILRSGALGQVPDDVRMLIEYEISALSAGEQRALEAASLIGAQFAVPLIAAALAVTTEDIEDSLFALARRQRIIEESEATLEWPQEAAGAQYRFMHALYPEVLSARIPPARRREWHRRMGRRLAIAYGEPSTGAATDDASPQGLAKGTASVVASTIARHFESGGDALASIEYYQYAITAAQEEFAYQRIVVAATAALALLARRPPGRERAQQTLAIRVTLGPMLVALEGYPSSAAAENSQRAVESARELGEALPLVLSLMLSVVVQAVRGASDAALTHAPEIEGLLEVLPPGLQQLALGGLGQVLIACGEFERARILLERGVKLPDDAFSLQFRDTGLWLDPVASCLCASGLVLTILGYPDQGRERLERAVQRAREQDHPISLMTVQLWAVFIHWVRHDTGALAANGEEIGRIAQLGEYFNASRHLRIVRQMSQAAYAPTVAHAEKLLEEINALGELGVRGGITLFPVAAAQALGIAGEPMRGLAVIDEALANVERGGERAVEAELHRLRGELLLASAGAAPGLNRSRAQRQAAALEQMDEAEVAFRRAITIAKHQHAKWWELRATLSLFRLLQKQGRPEAARAPLADIYGWFTEGFDTPDLQEAQTLLGQFDDPHSPHPARM